MSTYRQIRGALKLALCLLLCVGATLDDIDYINALRVRVSGANRSSPMVEDDSDDQHGHHLLASAPTAPHLSVPFLSALWTVQPEAALSDRGLPPVVRSARAPPAWMA